MSARFCNTPLGKIGVVVVAGGMQNPILELSYDDVAAAAAASDATAATTTEAAAAIAHALQMIEHVMVLKRGSPEHCLKTSSST